MSDRSSLARDANSALFSDEFERLLADGSKAVTTPVPRTRIEGVVVGTVIALAENGARPLVSYPGQPGTMALGAETTVDLHAAHIGRRAVLMFEGGDPSRPIVVGCLREPATSATTDSPDSVEIQADEERIVVSAREQLVLKCGKASITLTKAGKILIEGAYVSNRSSGTIRLRGGSVQIN